MAIPFSNALAQELLETYGSPLYVYQAERLETTIAEITQAIPYPKTKFHFASVTNGNLALLKRFLKAGWGLHANTPGDVYLGLHAGFAPHQIVYSGSNLSREDFEQIFDWGVRRINLDSVSQVQHCCEIAQVPIELGLRLNLPEITGESRIGVHPDEFRDAIAVSKFPITGLHFYRGTGTNATEAFTQVIDTVITTAKQLPDWRVLDFGGGFGYPYRKDGARFDWQEFGTVLSEKLSDVDLIIEPGRAAIAESGCLLARVVSVKWQGEKQIVGVDTSIANLAVLAVHGGYREIVSWKEGAYYLTDVCGNTTYSRDYLGKGCQLPELSVGDCVAILDTGAYGYAMSSHFLHRFRPAEVLLENQIHRLIRDREDYSVLLGGQR
ncbi:MULTISPECIES: diaminopimelate decarboxylase family protein [Leptolyngbya]|uniref:diaminopimelate decarboxylase family protein n=1 Tax=Leptolyngbya TaxID=47251 RepID=UPI0016844D4F|nr:decarboxylase [Leptolyngbya sp. FACHB-1624]MBD1858912.1 decarboxylase [Leptolyngbya sp. FACHB-1624]